MLEEMRRLGVQGQQSAAATQQAAQASRQHTTEYARELGSAMAQALGAQRGPDNKSSGKPGSFSGEPG
eukprot:2765295-Alexandrium_andersonii.AAC.1